MKTFSEYLEDKEEVIIDEEVARAAKIITSDIIEENAMSAADMITSYKAQTKAANTAAEVAKKQIKAFKKMSAAQAAQASAELDLSKLVNPTGKHVFGAGLGKFAVAASIIGLLITLGVKGYKKLAEKFHWSIPQLNLFKKKLKNSEIKQVVNQQKQQEEILEKRYENDLQDVYRAIDNKDWETAKIVWNMVPKTIQYSNGVSALVIKRIIKANDGDLPLYYTDRGNDTYKAIKKVLGLQTAKAAVRDFSSTFKGMGV